MKRIPNSETWMTNIERGRLQVLSKGKGTWMINMQMDNQPYQHGGPTCKAHMLITIERTMWCKQELDNGDIVMTIFGIMKPSLAGLSSLFISTAKQKRHQTIEMKHQHYSQTCEVND